jgi:hypothetical protein
MSTSLLRIPQDRVAKILLVELFDVERAGTVRRVPAAEIEAQRHHAEGTPLPRREQWARQGSDAAIGRPTSVKAIVAQRVAAASRNLQPARHRL